jgi:hypothetical protein
METWKFAHFDYRYLNMFSSFFSLKILWLRFADDIIAQKNPPVNTDGLLWKNLQDEGIQSFKLKPR